MTDLLKPLSRPPCNQLMFDACDLYDQTMGQLDALFGRGPHGQTGPCGGGNRDMFNYAINLMRETKKMQDRIAIILYARRLARGLAK